MASNDIFPEDIGPLIRAHPEILLQAYAYEGCFPMAEDKAGPAFWIKPKERGVFFPNTFHVPRSLQKIMRRNPFEIKVDQDFEGVITGCADRAQGTWINDDIRAAFIRLYQDGFAHSVECWQDGALVGGLYGLAIKGLFAGESMFSRVPNASKVALVYLVEHMKSCKMSLLDTQYTNPHLEQFQITNISDAEYDRLLAKAITQDVQWVHP